ncbi:MAG: oxidoreductase [Flavobacteriales bacterium]|nr:oxidoreductase [Flavobacteriales bacterium]
MRSVLVTGVSTGIGKAIAEELLNNEFIVIGSVRKESDGEDLKKQFEENFYPVKFDVTKKQEIQNAKVEVEKILADRKSYLSCVINNAGIALGGPVRYLDVDIFRKQFEVNFFGLIEVTKTFLDLLIDHNSYKMKNKIINIGSISGKRSYPFVGPYTASKHALEGFTDALRRELLIHDVDVVLIQPGPIRTPIWDKAPKIEDNPFLKTEYEIPLRKFNKGYIKLGVDGYSPTIIGNKIVEVMNTNKPRTRYVITPKIFKNYLIPGFLPDRWVDRLTGKMLGLLKKT